MPIISAHSECPISIKPGAFLEKQTSKDHISSKPYEPVTELLEERQVCLGHHSDN